MITVFLALLESDLLKWFVQHRDIDEWQDTAVSWLTAAVVISVLCAGLMLSYKWFRKRSAGVIKEQAWSRGETVVLMLSGLLPVFLGVLVVWYSSRDFFNIVGVGGLMKGVVFCWLLYLLLMFVGHALGPWRRELM